MALLSPRTEVVILISVGVCLAQSDGRLQKLEITAESLGNAKPRGREEGWVAGSEAKKTVVY